MSGPLLCVLIYLSPSLRSHPNSNLNIGCVAIKDGSPEFRRSGVWSKISLVRACTVVKGYFPSHSVVTRTRSTFSKVGIAKLFAHVYFFQVKPIYDIIKQEMPSSMVVIIIFF
jgi:hypothetical protein